MREVRKKRGPRCEAISKFVALAVREVLVLQVCCVKEYVCDIDFERAMEQASATQLDPELCAQQNLARNAIPRRRTFELAAPRIFRAPLSVPHSRTSSLPMPNATTD